jgi:hypothetical protein
VAAPLIVSLTTIRPRLATTPLTIASILFGSLRPDRLILWLDETIAQRDLPPIYAKLPATGLEIQPCADIGPHTKGVYAFLTYPQAIIVTADDDILYPRRWLADLVRSYQAAPTHIHTHRAHRMRKTADGRLRPFADWDRLSPGYRGPGHDLFITGVNGALYPPNSMPAEVGNIAALRRLTPRNDDIWFTAMALLQGRPIEKVRSHSATYPTIHRSQRQTLWSSNIVENDAQLQATFSHYHLYDRI